MFLFESNIMGTYTDIKIGDYVVWTSKSAVVPEVMTIFRETDRIDYIHDPTEESFNGYVTTVAIASHRMDIMGYTMERCRVEFDYHRKILIDEILERAGNPNDENDAPLDEYDAKDLYLFEMVDFDSYASALKKVVQNGYESYMLDDLCDSVVLDDITKYILDKDNYDWPYLGFFSKDIRYLIRMVLSMSDPDGQVEQDITALVEGEYYYAIDPVCEDAIHSLLSTYPQNAPIIILTEGKTDIEILQKSLEILYPHLLGYYRFFDFHGSNAGGGAHELIKIIKSFAATGIANRVIAILDNDTAAHDAKRALDQTDLPYSIAILHYPDIELLQTYPTIGPSGEAILNVNESAGSIELYLGQDVLIFDGKFSPILWKGYVEKLHRYQGEVYHKNEILDKWRKKAKQCKEDAVKFSKEHPGKVYPLQEAFWQDLRAVWKSIFSAFN